jgi:hypothetical protein
MRKPSVLLRELLEIYTLYGPQQAAGKLELLALLERRRLRTAGEVHRLHEALCFLQAYPDDGDVLAAVQRMLAGFSGRSDLRKFKGELVDSGIAGTETFYSFYWSTARWLARRWPDRLNVHWYGFEDQERLDRALSALVPYNESLALEEADLTTREWVETLKGQEETDAAFLIRRAVKLPGNDFTRETFFEEMEIPFVLSPGPGTPTRSGARYPGSGPVVFRSRPLDRARPSLREEILRPPRSVRDVSPREGEKLIDLTREAMVTRARDLYVFRFADKHDVRLVDCGQGLQFAVIGAVPERRLMLDAVYGFLTLMNGVPIGYVLSSSYFNSVEVAYNVFESFRGGEAAKVYGRVMGMMAWLFGADAFTIDPYQLGGEGNTEGLKSGAWWFYYKLGYRPRDPEVKRVLRGELKRMRSDPRHRSSIASLKQLSAANLFYFLGKPRDDIRGVLPLDRVGLWVSRYVARRFGSDREAAVRTCSEEARRLLGVRSLRAWSRDERVAWERWSPLMLSLPGVERWSTEDKRALGRVARAKGGRRESDFVLQFDRHRRLRRALLDIARRD